VDNFVTDIQKRNILRDRLGERMSLIYEYGKDRERKGEDRMIINMLKFGKTPNQIALMTQTPLSRIKAIEKRLKKKS
jgi:hypothetical protein